MKKYDQQILYNISSETRIKLKILSLVMHLPIVRLVELMTDRFWEEKQDAVSSMPQPQVNQAARKILEKMKPR